MPSEFKSTITADGSSGFKAEPGRYHLYYVPACPFAARAVIARKLKGLEDVISLSSCGPKTDEKGWPFSEEYPDPVNNCSWLSEVYKLADPEGEYKGRWSVPVLWDKQKKTIVSNESADLLRMLNKEFNEFCKAKEQAELDLYPESLQKEIDDLNNWIAPYVLLTIRVCQGFIY